MGLVYEGYGTLGLIPIVGTFEQVLVKVDLTDILIILYRLLVHNNVVNDTLRRYRGYLNFYIVKSESKVLHGLS